MKLITIIAAATFLSGCSVLDTVTHNDNTALSVSASLVHVNRGCSAKRMLCNLRPRMPGAEEGAGEAESRSPEPVTSKP